jgi:hypothetical protein
MADLFNLRNQIRLLPLLTLLVALPAGTALATHLSSPEHFADLCETSSRIPNVLEGTGESVGDPLLEVLHRRDYAFSRYRRLLEVYHVTLDSRRFRFLPTEPGMLTVDMLDSLTVFMDVDLNLGAAADLSFVLPQPECDDIQTGFDAEQVILRLYFHLSSLDDPDTDYCEVNDDGTLRLDGRLLAAELVSRTEGTVLAIHETDRLHRQRLRLGLDPFAIDVIRPNVLIIATDFPTTEPPNLEARILQAEAEARLMPCYVQGLVIAGRLQGAAVLSYRVDREGAVWDPVVDIDVVGQEVLTGCIVSTLGRINLPRLNPGLAFDVRMTAIFRLE